MESKRLVSPVSVLTDVDGSRHASGLTAARQVDGVPKEAVAGHAVPNNTCHYLTRVDPDGYTLKRRKKT